MSNFRRKGNIPFTMVPNILFEDQRLSIEAMLIQAYMMSKPETWRFNTAQIRHHFGRGQGDARKPLGRHTMLRAMTELIEAGWVERRMMRGEGGAFDGWEYVVLAVPKHVEVACNKLPESVVLEPQFDFQTMEPQSDYPTSDNRTAYKDLKVSKISSPPKSPSPPGRGTTPSADQEGQGKVEAAAPIQPAAPEPEGPDHVERRPSDEPDDDTLDRFDELWRRAPEPSRNAANRQDAQDTFAALSVEDQRHAIAAVEKAGSKALHRWLRAGRFRNVEVKLAAPAAPRGPRVFVKVDSPQWDAWAHYVRSQGRIPRSQGVWSEVERKTGWWFESEWPPSDAGAM